MNAGNKIVSIYEIVCYTGHFLASTDNSSDFFFAVQPWLKLFHKICGEIQDLLAEILYKY